MQLIRRSIACQNAKKTVIIGLIDLIDDFHKNKFCVKECSKIGRVLYKIMY